MVVWYECMVSDVNEDVRRRLLDALVGVAAERGLERASIREVASAAGMSIGAVQYYCRSKDEMLRMAFEHVIGRILARSSEGQRVGTIGQVLRRGLLEFLPLDETRRVEGSVCLAFAARAAVAPDLARVHHGLLAQMRGQCVRAFEAALERGEAVAELDPASAAVATAALVDGLVMHMLSDPDGISPEAAVDVLDAHLARYLRADSFPP